MDSVSLYINPSFRPACTTDVWLSLISVVTGVKNPGLYYIRLYCLTLTGSQRTNSTCRLSQLYEIKYWEEKLPFAQNLQYSLRSAPNQAGKVAVDCMPVVGRKGGVQVVVHASVDSPLNTADFTMSYWVTASLANCLT